MSRKSASEMPTAIHSSLITKPLPATQKHVLLALQEQPDPATSGELAQRLAARLGRSYHNLPSILSALVTRGLVRRQVVKERELYSRTPVAW
jgi:DNA-binding MarR family transcriptional regulator